MMKEELTKQIQLAINGDLAAFERVMRQKAKQILYVSVKLMKNPEDGEDAAQEAMLKMYQHLGELKDPAAFQSWMYQIITRTCIDIRRKQQVHDDWDYLEMRSEVKEMRREFLPQEYIEDVDKRDFLMKLINNLPENYRACLLMFYYEDMSYQQIAQAMGVSEKSVDNILQRGRRSIKKQLERRYGEKMKLLSLQGAALPVMTQLFQWDSSMQTSPETVSRILSELGTALTGTVLGAAGAGTAVASASGSGAASASGAAASSSLTGSAGSAASTASGASASAAEALAGANATAATAGGASVSTVSATGAMTLSTKAAIGVVAALTAAGGAVLVLQSTDSLSATADGGAVQEEQVILTLEDMIGEENANLLRSYTEGEGDQQAWDGYLERLNAVNISGAVLGEARYTLYHLEKQDKQLLILEKQEEEGLDVAYRFTDSHEEPPRRDELFSSLEVWRQ